ncbi:MAG: hypothetical protein JNK84_02495 [Phreatobacter sp.]|uniref:hypothetical protein n=1 Tax=Phreatobacter sp. TaxID=1966341 RepID=UPI001A4344E3|nr:hypothetical protein [Phreatobacter sp.]MBL8567931.1 hypothetical protein [Phreatobacter sp.]
MTITPCERSAALRNKIREFANVLRVEAHTLGEHGLDEAEFYDSGVLRGAIELLRGEFIATLRPKREFLRLVLNHMQDRGFVADWQSAGDANRHDYSIRMPSGRIAVIELKGCLDGNNTNIFERPPHANEFIIWSVCTNPGADPRHNAWSGIHTRLSADIISRQQVVDGVIIWDMVCGTIGRPCPKLVADPARHTLVGQHQLPPPCLYLFPSTVPSPRNNPAPVAQPLQDVQFMDALFRCFGGRDEEVNFVDFVVDYRGAETVRTTRIRRNGGTVQESRATPIRRT